MHNYIATEVKRASRVGELFLYYLLVMNLTPMFRNLSGSLIVNNFISASNMALVYLIVKSTATVRALSLTLGVAYFNIPQKGHTLQQALCRIQLCAYTI